MSPRRFAFLVNPRAGAGRSVHRLEQLLGRRPLLAESSMVRTAGTLEETAGWLERLAPGTVPVAAGGDGTLNLLVRATRLARCPGMTLGLLPLGTGNAVAHSLGFGRVEAAATVLHLGQARPLDLFVTTHPGAPLAIASISVGFEAHVMTQVSRFQTWRRLWGGVTGLAQAAMRMTEGVTIRLDGHRWLEPDRVFFTAGLYNLRRYAFGRLVFPEAALDDGRGEAMLYDSGGEYLAMLRRSIGVEQAALSTAARASRPFIRASVAGAEAIQFDGESIAGADFEVEVEPGAWRLLAPVIK